MPWPLYLLESNHGVIATEATSSQKVHHIPMILRHWSGWKYQMNLGYSSIED